MSSAKFYTLEEVAEILRTSVKTVRRRIASGTIKAFKEGGRVLVLADELKNYLSRTVGIPVTI